MQSKTDPRHTKRRLIVKSLYANSFLKQPASKDAKEILKNLEVIDKTITKAAPGRPLKEINKVDLAILRLAVYEFSKNEVPSKVVIDEAVELAKEFGAESAPSFVNGVLGTIIKHDNTRNTK